MLEMTTAFSMPPPGASLATKWAYLEGGIDHIMAELPNRYSYYMCLHTIAYRFCTSGVYSVRAQGLGDRRPTAVLYDKLARYFTTHVDGLKNPSDLHQDEAFLRYYIQERERYTRGATEVNRLFTSALNRSWVKREREEGRKDVYPVYTLALVQWERSFFLCNPPRLTGALFRLVERQRQGEIIDQTLVKAVIDSFVSPDLDEGDINKVVYVEHFEVPFLEMSKKYYEPELRTFLADGTVAEFLKKMEEWLREVGPGRCLDDTRTGLISNSQGISIHEHSEQLWENTANLQEILRCSAELQRVHALLARIREDVEYFLRRKVPQDIDSLLPRIPRDVEDRLTSILDSLRKLLEQHVKGSGLAAVSQLVGQGGTDSVDPTAYVNVLLDIHSKNSDIVTRCFDGKTEFVASLDKASREYVNENDATGMSTTRSAELLAKYVDALLRKNNAVSEEQDLEDALNKLMVLFRYINDKDVFQRYYAKKLSSRLIYGVSASDEAEASMISKLEKACGFEYVKDLQRMLTDVCLSKDLTHEFREHVHRTHNNADLDFSAMVLGASFWPLTPTSCKFIIPPDILPTYERFTKYYQRKHTGRKLTWLWNYSRSELRANEFDPRYILITNSWQMAILLQYNNNDTMPLGALVTATGASKDFLKQVLGILVKARILINEDSDQYDYNPNFRSKKTRINLNMPIRAEQKAESTEVINENRKYTLQTTIVRVMKARKQMRNQDLIHEVISQLSPWFVPNVPDIKKAIENLLDKDYIERVADTQDTFSYVA